MSSLDCTVGSAPVVLCVTTLLVSAHLAPAGSPCDRTHLFCCQLLTQLFHLLLGPVHDHIVGRFGRLHDTPATHREGTPSHDRSRMTPTTLSPSACGWAAVHAPRPGALLLQACQLAVTTPPPSPTPLESPAAIEELPRAAPRCSPAVIMKQNASPPPHPRAHPATALRCHLERVDHRCVLAWSWPRL